MPGYEKDKAKVQDQLRRIEGLYRKYYGGRMSLYLLGVSYVAMVLAGLIIGALFQALGRVPSHHFVAVFQTHPTWNYTTFLNLAVLALIALLGWRFLRTGGPEMLRAMEISPDEKAKLATDPVCGMAVDRATAKETLEHDGTTYYFCSADDRKAFEKDPKHYLVLAGNPDRADSGSTTVDPVCGMTIDPLTAAGQATFEGETYFFCSAGCKTTFEENPVWYARGASVRQERGRADPFRYVALTVFAEKGSDDHLIWRPSVVGFAPPSACRRAACIGQPRLKWGQMGTRVFQLEDSLRGVHTYQM